MSASTLKRKQTMSQWQGYEAKIDMAMFLAVRLAQNVTDLEWNDKTKAELDALIDIVERKRHLYNLCTDRRVSARYALEVLKSMDFREAVRIGQRTLIDRPHDWWLVKEKIRTYWLFTRLQEPSFPSNNMVVFTPTISVQPPTKVGSQEPVLIDEDGDELKKSGNRITILPNAPKFDASEYEGNCAFNAVGYVVQDMTLEGAHEAAEVLTDNIASESLSEYMKCVKKSPERVTEVSERWKTTVLNGLKQGVAERSKKGFMTTWISQEFCYNTRKLSAYRCRPCGHLMIKEDTNPNPKPNITGKEFKKILSGKPEVMSNLCEGQCKVHTPHERQYMLTPEVIVVDVTAEATQGDNLEVLFEAWDQTFELRNGDESGETNKYRLQIACAKEEITKEISHAFCLKKLSNGEYMRMSDDNTKVRLEPVANPTKLEKDTTLRYLFYIKY